MTDSEQKFPSDATMLFGIGAQKAGTTWLFSNLKRSNQIHFNETKELHYFNAVAGRANTVVAKRVAQAQTLARRLKASPGSVNIDNIKHLRDVLDLLSLYTGDGTDHTDYIKFLKNGYAGQKIIGDITPGYSTLSERHFSEMAEIGNAKFIYILRDPADRMWSQIRMSVRAKFKGQELDYDKECLDRATHLIENNGLTNVTRGSYKATITKLEKAVPRERIKYVFFERLFEPETMVDICNFLGIDTIPSTPDQIVGLGRKATLPDTVADGLRRGLATQYEFAHGHFGAEIPEQWKS